MHTQGRSHGTSPRMSVPPRSLTFLIGLTPLPSLATMLVAAAFILANLGGSSTSMRSYEYGFPLMYRNLAVGVEAFHPVALNFDLVVAATAIASTFVATRRWSRLIDRYQRFTV